MTNWQNILEACRRADSRAERQLFDCYGEACFRRALRYLGSAAEAQDVVGKAFIKAFRALPKTEFTELPKFEGWLLRIVTNEALMLLRERKKHVTVALEAMNNFVVEGSTLASTEMETQELVEQIERLPTGYRRVMKLFAIQGYSHAEIGKRLNISEGTSRSQLSKARNLLKKQLKLRGYD